jgi:predicted transglutaminase-like cysteine proteinase
MTNGTRRRYAWGTLLISAVLLPGAGMAGEAGANKIASPGSATNIVSSEKLILEPWSENLFAQIEKEFGPAAAKRLRYVYDTARANQSKPIHEKLVLVNSTLNKLPWISDQQQWNAEDYWATPLEILSKAGGDCEDMAIGKLVMLRMMGVPRQNLYLGYGKIKSRNEAHMVLIWANDKRTDVRVLDSFVTAVKTPKERMDLQMIYLTDVDGNVILIEDAGGRRRIKAEIGAQRLSKLETVKQRVLETREKYKEFNEGRPLFSQ